MSCKKGATVVIVTHNASLAPIADRVIQMHDASVKSVVINPQPQDIDDLEYWDEKKDILERLAPVFHRFKGTFFIHPNSDDVGFFGLGWSQSS